MTVLTSIVPSLMLYGLPMLLAGLAALAARGALDRAPFIAPDMVPFFSKLKTFFCCWGWMYILGLFVGVLFLLAYTGIALWAVSSGQAEPHAFFPR
jgi:hypothetical protein